MMRILGSIFVLIFLLGCDAPIETGTKTTTLGKEAYAFDISASVNPQRVVILNTPAVGFLDALNIRNRVVGAMSLERLKASFPIFSENCFDFGNEEPSLEQLIALRPDVVIVNPYQMKKYKTLKEKLNFFVMDEYNAKSVKESLTYYSLLGMLFSKKEEGDKLYAEKVSALRRLPRAEKKILKMDVYSGSYFVPSCAGLWEDALNPFVLKWICVEGSGGKISKEKAKLLLDEAELLLVIRNGDVESLSSEWLSRLNATDAVKEIVYCNTNNYSFFEQFTAHPDIVLKQLIQAAKTETSNHIFKWKQL